MVSLRTFSVLTVAAFSLAACGGSADEPTATATPQFVEPSVASAPASIPPASVTPPLAPSAAPTVTGPASAKPTVTANKKPASVKYTFPVRASNVDYHPTHSAYPATDIFADCGEPVVATTSGVVLEISLTDTFVKGRPDGPLNGGLFVSILGDDGVRYYGSHLSKVQGGIKPGVRVSSGQLLGAVGHTGNANNVCHLHYGISPPCEKVGDWDVRRGVVWPAPFLNSWRKGGGKSPVAEVEQWRKAEDCKG
ncbi:M23 family metallopeptidase [Actinoplanes sp. NPDC051859]|uniref:M23 family metallopeptidase n=1 Tax=Actinoplanes sp. NPDC051859 TaxID=3363909 RepID=UPI0037A9897C